MKYRKFLWGGVMVIGFFAAAVLWYKVPGGGATHNGESEVVIGDSATSTPDDTSLPFGGNSTMPTDAVRADNGQISSAKHDSASIAEEDQNDRGVATSDSSGNPDPEVNIQPLMPSSSQSLSSSSAAPSSSTDATALIATASSSVSASCVFAFPSSNVSSTLSHKVIFNEIAWMGSDGVSTGEWMEIKNISGSDVDLSGWQLMNASGKIKIIFGTSDNIPAGGILLLARTSAVFANGVTSQKIYSGDLRNAGDDLALVDASCGISDLLTASSTSWPAGNNTTKQTMERDADGVGWHTSIAPGGTPGKENSVPPPPTLNKVIVSFEGSGSATVVSSPSGMVCGAECVGNYASGTKITLTATPAVNTAFLGWSGICYGQSKCTFTLTKDVDISAVIRSTLALSAGTSSDSAKTVDAMSAATSTSTTETSTDVAAISTSLSSSTSTSTATSTSTSTDPASPPPSSSSASMGHLLIAAIQIAGSTASNDLVKIYNPTSASIDMSGWKLRKRSQTGTDYSIREFSTGTIVLPQHYFVWANSADGFADSVGADVSSTQTLAADNSVALIDATGATVDAVAWGTGTGQYGEGSPYPTSPGANQMLVRQSAGGTMVDTDNNANDFTLQ